MSSVQRVVTQYEDPRVVTDFGVTRPQMWLLDEQYQPIKEDDSDVQDADDEGGSMVADDDTRPDTSTMLSTGTTISSETIPEMSSSPASPPSEETDPYDSEEETEPLNFTDRRNPESSLSDESDFETGDVTVTESADDTTVGTNTDVDPRDLKEVTIGDDLADEERLANEIWEREGAEYGREKEYGRKREEGENRGKAQASWKRKKSSPQEHQLAEERVEQNMHGVEILQRETTWGIPFSLHKVENEFNDSGNYNIHSLDLIDSLNSRENTTHGKSFKKVLINKGIGDVVNVLCDECDLDSAFSVARPLTDITSNYRIMGAVII